jgi:hypothetical protein
MHETFDFPALDDSHPGIVPLLVMSLLSDLAAAEVNQDDIPFIIDFLDTKSGHERAAVQRWHEYWNRAGGSPSATVD